MKYLILLLAASSAYAAIDGSVVNGTTNKPQANATVTLFQTTQEGPKDLGSVKTDAAGKFVINQNVQPGQGGGPLLLQAVYGGVQYNKMIPPGQPTTGVEIPVYEPSKKPEGTTIEQHVMLLEPSPNGQLNVRELYVYKNEGKTTWNDPDKGTLQFYLPPASEGKVAVNVLAPGGMPIRRAPDPGAKPYSFKLDFPIKPGESRVDMTWTEPFSSPGVFQTKALSRADAIRILTPPGVTLKGSGVEFLGSEPTTLVNIYGVNGPDIQVNVEGTGSLQEASGGNGDSGGGASISENLPKLYGLAVANSSLVQTFLAVKWVVATILGMLALGFILLYRKGDPNSARSQ